MGKPGITFDPPYRSDVETALNEDGVDNARASALAFVHQHHNTIQREILEVLSNHPLDADCSLHAASDVTVVIEAGEVGSPAPSPVVNSAAWPKLALKLPNDDGVVQNLHAILCHEFTHTVDRLNPEFGLRLDSEVPPRVMTLWNHSIDARLARHGVRVPHLVEEPIDPTVASAIAGCERPTYTWLVQLAGEDVVDHYTPP